MVWSATRAVGVASLLELGLGREDASHPVLVIRRIAQRELEVLYADPEAEVASDVWDLQKAGIATEGRYRMLQNGWVLVHDMPKVAVKDFRLFIARSTIIAAILARRRAHVPPSVSPPRRASGPSALRKAPLTARDLTYRR